MCVVCVCGESWAGIQGDRKVKIRISERKSENLNTLIKMHYRK